MGSPTQRSQTDVLGDVLLVGIVVVLSVIAMLMALMVLEDSETTELATLGSTTEADNLTIRHVAGQPLAIEDTTVLFRQDGAEWEIPLSAFEWIATDGNDTLTAGDRLRHPHGAEPGSLSVLIINERENSVVHRAELTVPEADQ